jgi:uncharacterized protein involved in cysteine biosynthesis
MSAVLTPIARAVGQLDDPVLLGVVLRGVALALLAFALLWVGAVAAVDWLIGWRGPLAWGTDILSAIGAALLAWWLFVPLAAAIAALYVDRVAAAVERRWYPEMPPGCPASAAAQAWDAIVLGGRVLLVNLLALPLMVLLPGIGFVLIWVIAAWAIGRGLFVTIAMRRMGRVEAEALYRSCRGAVVVQGLLLALISSIPAVNLLLPVIGTAMMVHLFDRATLGR